jgi:hypothetical protein
LLYAQLREKSRAGNVAGNNLNHVEQGIRRNYIINLDYSASQMLHFRSRVQSSSYTIDQNTSNGFTILQDINIHFRKFVFSGRLALYDTDDFQNRQYVYEKDVLYAFSIPAYHGIGTRGYMLLQYKASSKMQYWFRFSRTRFYDRDFIGSGLERIEGNLRSDIKFQILYRL